MEKMPRGFRQVEDHPAKGLPRALARGYANRLLMLLIGMAALVLIWMFFGIVGLVAGKQVAEYIAVAAIAGAIVAAFGWIIWQWTNYLREPSDAAEFRARRTAAAATAEQSEPPRSDKPWQEQQYGHHIDSMPIEPPLSAIEHPPVPGRED